MDISGEARDPSPSESTRQQLPSSICLILTNAAFKRSWPLCKDWKGGNGGPLERWEGEGAP
jgi:hypothetical protein